MAQSRNEALVFGASGIIGWSVVNQLLEGYPGPEPFAKVTAVVNRPLTVSDSHWPSPSADGPQLQIATGVDLTNGTEDDVASALKERVPGVENVTHVFYFVFKPVDGATMEAQTNLAMMKRVVEAIKKLVKGLKSFVYAGGTRGYGIYIPGGTFKAPLEESMADNLPEDYAKTVAYPLYRKMLSDASSREGWTWTEACPDVVVGFTPQGSGYSLALHWAQYLSLFAHNHGVSEGTQVVGAAVEAPFPGNAAAYDALFTPVSSRNLGRSSIYAALHPNECGARIFNVADCQQPTSFRAIWPALAAWFGLVGVDPVTEDIGALKPGEYIMKYRHMFEDMGRPKGISNGVGVGSTQLDSVGWWLTFDRQLSLERLKTAGFNEEQDPVEGWLEAFRMFRKAGIIL